MPVASKQFLVGTKGLPRQAFSCHDDILLNSCMQSMISACCSRNHDSSFISLQLSNFNYPVHKEASDLCSLMTEVEPTAVVA